MTPQALATLEAEALVLPSRAAALQLFQRVFTLGLAHHEIAGWPLALEKFGDRQGEFLCKFRSNAIGSRHVMTDDGPRSMPISTSWGVILHFGKDQTLTSITVERLHERSSAER